MAESIDSGSAGSSPNTTNTFYYTYSNTEKVPEIIPKTYYEAMSYLDGRRKFQQAMGLDGNCNPEETPFNILQSTEQN